MISSLWLLLLTLYFVLGKKEPNANVAAFVDPLSVAFAEPDVRTSSSVELEAVKETGKLEEEWCSLEASVKDKTFHGKVEVPEPLHYLFSKLDADLSSPPTNANPQARLEWLESAWSASQATKRSQILEKGVTATDFFDFMDACNGQLAQYWKDDQRVQVVKMTIQLSKMLSPEKPHDSFYPTLFFLVTDVISYFGELVYDRLVSKCPDLRVNFSIGDVSPQALELCKNWLYKIASVRGKKKSCHFILLNNDSAYAYVELVPRFYLEAALLKCYRFSCDAKGYPALVERLTLMIRGLADPIAAAYARMYLVRVTHLGKTLLLRDNSTCIKGPF